MKDITCRGLFILCVIAVTASVSIAGETITWEERDFEDFANGRLDASGQNIYVSRDGKIRTILKFDINDDGYLDLFFGNTHDIQSLVPPTVCAVTSGGCIKQHQLGVKGSSAVESADLNRDGFTDLVFIISNDGLQISRSFVDIVYGGKDGWASDRITGHLPVYSPIDIAVADLNADKWPDIIVLQLGNTRAKKHEPVAYITIFWGGEDGYLFTRYQEVQIPKAKDLASADFNNDGNDDVSVLTEEGKIKVIWAKKSELPVDFKTSGISLKSDSVTSLTAADYDRDGNIDLVVGSEEEKLYLIKGSKKCKWRKPKAIDCMSATDIKCSDMDKDGFNDLLLTYFNIGRAGGGEAIGAGADIPDFVTILWGDKKGFSKERSSKLDSKNAYTTAAEDLDNDGVIDVAIGIYQAEKTFDSESIIYFGSGDRKFKLSSQKIQTKGVTDVVIVPSKNGLPSRVVFANSLGGTLNEKVPVFVYWGTADGFNVSNRWNVPCKSGNEASAFDLNADGFTDFVTMFTSHGGSATEGLKLGAHIFWGSCDGFDLQNRSVVEDPWQAHSNATDLNRDGYLDLVLGGYDPWSGPEKGKPAKLNIYYGSADGFSQDNKTSLESKGRSHGPIIADFNKDDWLDLFVTSYSQDCSRIFWGGCDGFDAARQQKLTVPTPIGLESADLNADGYLDLIIASYNDRLDAYFDTGSYIFWGSSDGFTYSNSQWLPGNCTLFHTVADFDGDGYLDLFCPNYHSQLNRENLLSPIYWGSPDGFDSNRKTMLLCNSASGGQAGDFNRDGLIDLAVSNHTVHGKHKTDSKVFYNDGNRFTNPKIEHIETIGSHAMWVEDMGHIYDRSYVQRYESSVFCYDKSVETGQLTYNADKPDGTELIFSVRSAPCKDALTHANWRCIDLDAFPVDSADRCLQYKAEFKSDNGDRYPVLDSVKLELSGKL